MCQCSILENLSGVVRIIGSKPYYIGVGTSRRIFVWSLTLCLSAATIPSYLIQTIAGSDNLGDGGPAALALLATVEGVAADPLGNYYLADTDSNKIRRISPKGIITTVAGTGKAGFSGDGGPATLAQFNLPYGLAADLAGNVYVADFGNHCVRKISPDGLISTVAGLTPDTQISGPRNLAVDSSGNLYIADFTASRVYRLTPRGVFTAYAGSATASGLGDNGLATLARLQNPAGLAVDFAGALYIADSGNKRIRKVSGGIISSLAVTVVTPIGLAIDYSNELYVADYGNADLLRITNLGSDKPAVKTWPYTCRDVAIDYNGNLLLASGNTVSLFDGSRETTLAGGHDFLFAGDEASAASARLNRPLGLARDPAGTLYIADSANKRIRRITADGIIHTFLDGLLAPAGLAFDNSTGNLYIADAGLHAILVSRADGTLAVLAGGNGQGFSGDNGLARAAKLNAPSAIALDPFGNLFIADEANNRVRMITPDGKIQTLAQLEAPAGLLIDYYGRLLASESGAGRIVQIDSAGVAQPLSNAGLWVNPRGLASGPDGAVFIADPGAQRITRIDLDGTVSLAAGSGARGFAGDGTPAAFANFDTPSAVVVDPVGTVYVSDTANNRIRALSVNTAAIAAPITATQLLTIVNAASRLPGPVAAGELVTILGTGVDGYDIQLNSTPLVPVSTKPGEATIALPDSLDVTGTLEIQLLLQGVPQARITAPLVPAALGLFPSAIVNNDGTPNTSDNPASRGSTVIIYGTGEGRTGVPLAAVIDGQPMGIAAVAPAADNLNMFEMIAFIPAGYFPAGAKTLQVSTGASTSQAGVTVFVR